MMFGFLICILALGLSLIGDNYYNDVWVLDLHTCSWTQLDIRGQQPHGRFSHSAVVIDSDIAIYGGCGEDERPLNELLILQLGDEHPNGRYNISLCKIFGNHWNQAKRKYVRETGNMRNMVFSYGKSNCSNCEKDADHKHPILCSSDGVHAKRKINSNPKAWDVELEEEEHSHSVSQHSSQSLSHSHQEQTMVSPLLGLCKKQNQTHNHHQSNDTMKNQMEKRNCVRRTTVDFPFMTSESQRHPKTEQFLRVAHTGSQDVQYSPADQKLPQQRPPGSPLLGAEVRGTVDGAFDSGYLMTANVNGQIFRGVLFSPGPGVVTQTARTLCNPSPATQFVVTRPFLNSNLDTGFNVRPPHPETFLEPESGDPARQAQQPNIIRATPSTAKQQTRLSSDLQGVVLTL